MIKTEFWSFGLFLGFAITIFVALIILGANDYITLENINLKNEFPLFRGIALFIYFVWMFALNVYIWDKYHIDYKLVFGLSEHYSQLTQVNFSSISANYKII